MPYIRINRVSALTFIPINREESHWGFRWIDTRTRQYNILNSLMATLNTARHNVDIRLMREFM
jgi:hypothetical protein